MKSYALLAEPWFCPQEMGGGDFLGDEFIGKNGNLRAYGLNMKKQGKSFLVGFFLGFLVGFPSF